MSRKFLLGLGVAAAAVSVVAYAQKYDVVRDDAARGLSADLTVRPEQRFRAPSRLAPLPSTLATPLRATASAKLAPPIYDVTSDDVYDVDSFGRYVKWLGLTSAFINVQTGCAKPASPDEFCQELSPTPGAVTAFTFNDAARIKLPKGASNSLLCYWFSPLLNVTYSNPGVTRAIGRFRYTPTLTIENPLLDDPSLVDPTTGAPFGGKLLTSMTSSESFQEALEPGVTLSERSRDSTVCMAGFVSHRALIENYGLTPAQADAFFEGPTTIRLNVSGSVQNVSNASMVFGLRVVGD